MSVISRPAMASPAADPRLAPSAEPAVPTADHLGMELLAAGVPLSLICDLADVDGPVSAQICAEEPGDVTWCAQPG